VFVRRRRRQKAKGKRLARNRAKGGKPAAEGVRPRGMKIIRRFRVLGSGFKVLGSRKDFNS
jgi:hypothetical protein